MEAKTWQDTVITNLARTIMNRPDLPMGQAIAIEQAEITWKAREPEIAEARKAGMMVVVEFVNTHLRPSPSCSYKFCFSGRAWQAFLKSRGIDK